MKAKSVYMSLELNVKCPSCGHYFDLFENQQLTSDNYLYNLVCSTNGNNNNWGCADFQKQLDENDIEIHCSECGIKIEIESVGW